jgi:hypothetical protein
VAKEEIYTIPLWDAVRSNDECPFCFIQHKLEKDILDFCMSDAYMQPDFRQTTNAIGFCRSHYSELYKMSNKLGLVLVNQSHLMEMLDKFEKASRSLSSSKQGLFKKTESDKSPLDQLYTTLIDDCYICQRIDNTMNRYYDTFFYLYKKDSEFVEQLNSTKGFCMPHYIKLINTGRKVLKAQVFDSFITQTMPLFKDNIHRVLDDMQWFVNKYDYRYEKEPWKNAKDAPIKSIQKLNGTKPD